MSYLVLARKYRPRNFAEMVGQEHVVQALSNALTQQRLHHAYLFTGTRGVGKTTVSRILAKSLNCTGADGQGGITATPCGVCPACTQIDAGRFVDYTELDAASNRGVDEVQPDKASISRLACGSTTQPSVSMTVMSALSWTFIMAKSAVRCEAAARTGHPCAHARHQISAAMQHTRFTGGKAHFVAFARRYSRPSSNRKPVASAT